MVGSSRQLRQESRSRPSRSTTRRVPCTLAGRATTTCAPRRQEDARPAPASSGTAALLRATATASSTAPSPVRRYSGWRPGGRGILCSVLFSVAAPPARRCCGSLGIPHLLPHPFCAQLTYSPRPVQAPDFSAPHSRRRTSSSSTATAASRIARVQRIWECNRLRPCRRPSRRNPARRRDPRCTPGRICRTTRCAG